MLVGIRFSLLAVMKRFRFAVGFRSRFHCRLLRVARDEFDKAVSIVVSAIVRHTRHMKMMTM